MFRHTERTDKIIRAGYANATPVREIAAALGVSRNVVIGRAARLGLSKAGRQKKMATGPIGPTGYSETIRQLAANEYWRGKTQRQVAEQFGVDRRSVREWSRTR